MCLFGGFLLPLGHIETFINSGAIGNHAVDNGDLFCIYRFYLFLWGLLGRRVVLQHWAEIIKKMERCLKTEKENLECIRLK